ncbi:PhoH-like protein [Oceanococcus atlanticus]|uniref:PhoH-like protein n=1 Tax=Oceanococcus atlanticus TaxID=1317117 RepID=A0A1Y1SE43_9GAMM|nr:PhoH family protein [Oceanococcus atlanticus]ORE87258.1 PhoH-like protein [Oceanococcus atlanticus]
MNTSKQLRLQPESQDRLSALCGPADQHLRQLERDLNVEIRNRAYDFEILGSAEAVEQAAMTVRRLYGGNGGATVDREAVHMAAREQVTEDSAEPLRIRTRRGVIRPRNPSQAHYLGSIQRHDLVFGVGPAGTGKTYLAVAAAVEALERDEVRRIMLVRPAVEAGERLGFLPGDLAQKIDPYLRPLYDALYEMLGFEKVGRLIERNIIEVAPLAYMRGRTLNESFIIMDEAQNATVAQMKMFLTRLGFGSTAVVTGDVTQVDLPRPGQSGLRHATQVLDGVPGISFTYFRSGDVVRHPLVQRIVDAYGEHEGANDGGDAR